MTDDHGRMEEPDMKKEKTNTRFCCRSAILLATVIGVCTAFWFCEVWAREVPATDRPSIVVKDETSVKGEKIYLKDVAFVEGPASFQERLGTTYLASAPRPGKYKILRGSRIESKIRSKEWLPKDTILEIPDSVRVGRTSQLIDEDSLFSYYADFIGQELEGSEADFRIRRFKVTGNGPLREGDIRVELKNQTDGKLAGHVGLNAILRVNGEIERRLVLSGWIDSLEDVVCAVRPLPRHAIVTNEDVHLEKRNTSRLPSNIARSVDGVTGKRLKHALKAGAVLMANAVAEPPLIKKGDRVTIVAQSSSVRITALGVAKSQGLAGEEIRVRNLMNNREITAFVVSSSTVRVEF
jgi:flagella basal body P-ring formation protein FlgA